MSGGTGFLAGVSDSVQRAGQRDVVDVVAGSTCERSGLPPARHAAVDQLRIAREAYFGPDAEPLHHTGAETLDQRIGLFDQLQRGFDRFRFLQIERDRLRPRK